MTPHKTTAPQKPTLSDRLAYLALIIIEKVLGALPCSFVWKLGALLGAAAYPLSGKRRAIVHHNLSMVHPEASAEEISQLSKSVFRNSYANLLCSLNTSGRPHRNIEHILTLADLHNIENIPKEQGAILLLFHMGNWEILTKMHELIPNENPVGGMYRPLKNPLIDEHVKKQRESGGSQLFSRKRGLIMAQKFLKKGGFLGILMRSIRWPSRTQNQTIWRRIIDHSVTRYPCSQTPVPSHPRHPRNALSRPVGNAFPQTHPALPSD